jgi:hypothetical protein
VKNSLEIDTPAATHGVTKAEPIPPFFMGPRFPAWRIKSWI